MMEADTRYLLKMTDEQKEYAAEHLNEIDDDRDACIEEIRSWINESEDFVSRTDDFFIMRFLRGCKFDIEKTKLKLRKYHEERTLSPEWFDNRDPFLPKVQEMLDMGVFLPLRQVDEEGCLVVVIRACVHNPREHTIADFLKASIMVLDLVAQDHVSSSLHGIVAIIDMAGAQLSHALQMVPSVVRRLVNTWYGYPNRIRSLDYVNAPFHVNFILNIFKQFMGRKLKERIHVHQGGSHAMLKKMPASILPADLGGTDGDYETLTEYWKKETEDNKQWFLDDQRYKMKI